LLASRWAWIGAAIALVIFLPNVIWEARHGWPQIEVVRNAQQFKNEPISVWRFLGEQILFLDPVALPVWFGGLVWLFVAKEARRFRFLGFAYAIVMLVIMGLGGKSYYPLPVYTILAAAGGVAFERFAIPAARWLRGAITTLVIAGGIAGLPLAVPVLPVDTLLRYSQALPFTRVQTERDATANLSQLYADMFGWPELARRVGAVYHSLPPSEQSSCAILGGNYGEAGAIDYYGPEMGLPSAISGHNSYFDWGPRNYTGDCMVIFGERAKEFTQYFGESELADTVSNPDGMPSEQEVQIYVCRKPKAPLSVLWPNFKLII